MSLRPSKRHVAAAAAATAATASASSEPVSSTSSSSLATPTNNNTTAHASTEDITVEDTGAAPTGSADSVHHPTEESSSTAASTGEGVGRQTEFPQTRRMLEGVFGGGDAIKKFAEDNQEYLLKYAHNRKVGALRMSTKLDIAFYLLIAIIFWVIFYVWDWDAARMNRLMKQQ